MHRQGHAASKQENQNQTLNKLCVKQWLNLQRFFVFIFKLLLAHSALHSTAIVFQERQFSLLNIPVVFFLFLCVRN